MKAVLITTDHRGVFFGYIDPAHEKDKDLLVVERCRCAIYWKNNGGVFALATDGPEHGSKIGREAPRVILHGIESVSDCTPEAEKAWTEYPTNS